MKEEQGLTLLILPTKQLKELGILQKTDWQYVESITDIKTEMDISDSLQQIKEFYGGTFDESLKAGVNE